MVHIRPLKVNKKKEDVKDDLLQHSLDLSRESSSNDDDESYKAIDSSQEIHLTGDGTKIFHFFCILNLCIKILIPGFCHVQF